MGPSDKNIKTGLDRLREEFGEAAVARAVDAVKRFEVEVPSWLFGMFGGGRFAGCIPPGGARTIEEKLDDIAFVRKLTGATPQVATHLLWDFSRDGYDPDFEIAGKVAKEAVSRGLRLGFR